MRLQFTVDGKQSVVDQLVRRAGVKHIEFDIKDVHPDLWPNDWYDSMKQYAHRKRRRTAIKALVYEGLGSEVAPHMQRHTQALAECFRSNDHKEGVAAFLERRDARFTGT